MLDAVRVRQARQTPIRARGLGVNGVSVRLHHLPRLSNGRFVTRKVRMVKGSSLNVAMRRFARSDAYADYSLAVFSTTVVQTYCSIVKAAMMLGTRLQWRI